MHMNDILDGIKNGKEFEYKDEGFDFWKPITHRALLLHMGTIFNETDEYDNVRIKEKPEDIISENICAIIDIVNDELGMASPARNKIMSHLKQLIEGYQMKMKMKENSK